MWLAILFFDRSECDQDIHERKEGIGEGLYIRSEQASTRGKSHGCCMKFELVEGSISSQSNSITITTTLPRREAPCFPIGLIDARFAPSGLT